MLDSLHIEHSVLRSDTSSAVGIVRETSRTFWVRTDAQIRMRFGERGALRELSIEPVGTGP